MKKVSYGIILPGDPSKKQEKRKWLTVLSWICEYGWMIVSAIMVITIITAFIKDNRHILFAGLWMIPLAGCLLLCAFVWGDKNRCPYCGHFRELRPISKEMYVGSSSQDISQTEYDYHSGVVYNLSGSSAFYSVLSSQKVHGKEVTDEYAQNYRCRICGCVEKVKVTKTYKEF